MPLSLINSVASWFLRKRFQQIEYFMTHPNEVQEALLMSLISKAKDTELGRKYGFSSINSYADFARQVPITTYEEYHPYIERSRNGEDNIFWPTPIRWFAKSSGTTNARSKFIPVSQEALENCHYEASKDMLSIYLNNNPDSQLFTGKGLRLGGSKELYKEKGTSFGDLSAILIDNMPFWAEYSSTPRNKISLLSDWEIKMQAIVDDTITENVTSLMGVPSWMMVLLNNVLETTNKESILEVWPDLEVYFHGGVSFAPYRKQYENILPKNDFRYYEAYNASEGFFAIQDSNHSEELLLMLDYGIFYEFIPMDVFGSLEQRVIPLSEVEVGKNYAILITTNAGLWRYQIGDTIRFTNTTPYRIKVSGRTKHFINVFGEELIIENAESALQKAMEENPCKVKDYTVAPIFMEGKQKGRHQWIIEFSTPPADLESFIKCLDLKLQAVNSDYEAKRYNDTTLRVLEVVVAREGLFYDWLKDQDKLGGQHKIPRLSNSRAFADRLIQMNKKEILPE